MPHSPAPRRANLVEGWLEKFDNELRTLGIVPQGASEQRAQARPASSTFIEEQLAIHLEHVAHRVIDNRAKGGALQVKLGRDDARARMALARLGFKEVNRTPLLFWRS